MKSNITSAQYAKLAGRTLNAIDDLRSTQVSIDKLFDELTATNVSIARGEQESELAFLGRIASELTEMKHDLQKVEALADIDESINSERCITRPRTAIGRFLGNLSRTLS